MWKNDNVMRILTFRVCAGGAGRVVCDCTTHMKPWERWTFEEFYCKNSCSRIINKDKRDFISLDMPMHNVHKQRTKSDISPTLKICCGDWNHVLWSQMWYHGKLEESRTFASVPSLFRKLWNDFYQIQDTYCSWSLVSYGKTTLCVVSRIIAGRMRRYRSKTTLPCLVSHEKGLGEENTLSTNGSEEPKVKDL